jgi:hypothetical protein
MQNGSMKMSVLVGPVAPFNFLQLTVCVTVKESTVVNKSYSPALLFLILSMVSNKVFSGGIRGFVFNGGVDFLFSGMISFLTIKYVVIPLHDQHGRNITMKLSEKSSYFDRNDESFVFQV